MVALLHRETSKGRYGFRPLPWSSRSGYWKEYVTLMLETTCTMPSPVPPARQAL